MFCLPRKLFGKTILTTAIALSMATVVTAQDTTPATGLGQSWPNATDVSTNVHYHVYRFERDGVAYIQVNDLQGQVRAAFATTQNGALTLPVGMDAQHVKIVTGPAAASLDATQVVYQDSALTVTVLPQGDGSLNIMAMMGDCSDPALCALNRVAQ
jgi:hypothetical protein